MVIWRTVGVRRRSRGGQIPSVSAERQFENRPVTSEDPSLSPEANRLLTEELRTVVGSDHVRVPRDAPHHEREAHGGHGGFAESLAANRVLIAITFVALVVIGAIVALATDSWWAVVVAAVVHAAGTFIVLATLAGMTRQTEHVAPDVAAKLADEGVLDPDAELSRLVEEFSGEDSGEGSAEMVTSGRNEQRVHPQDSPAQAATEQRTANTPAGVPTQPAGTGSGIDRFMPIWVVGALMAVAVVVGALAPVIGTRFLVVPAIGLPVGAIWLLMRKKLDDGDEAPRSRGRVLAFLAATVVAVGAFVLLMGWLAGEL